MDKSTEFMQPPVSAFHTTTYNGFIKQYYGDSLLQECPIIITYDNSIGTFKTKTLHLFFTDSLRITTIEGKLYSGYLFPDDICFESKCLLNGKIFFFCAIRKCNPSSNRS